MAYVPSTTEEQQAQQPNNPNQPNAPQNMPPAPQTSGAAAGTGGAVGGGGQGVSATPTGGKAPPVQNLSDYLTANAPQAQEMAQNISTGLTTEANKVSGDINADQAALDTQIQGQNITPNPGLVSRAAANPSGFVQNPQDLTDFLAQENAAYNGPTTAESTPAWQTLNNEVATAEGHAPNLSSPEDFLRLAGTLETNPTAGMTNLDAALLEETPGAAQKITATAPLFQALPGQLSGASAKENAAIQQAQKNAQTASGLIAPAFTTGPNAAVPAWESALQGELSNAQQKTNAYNDEISNYDRMVNDLQTHLSPFESAIAAAGGPSAIDYTAPTYNPVTAAPTVQNVATPQDYSMEAALEQLLGGRLGTTPINQSTVGQAGSFKMPGTTPMTREELAAAFAGPLGKAYSAATRAQSGQKNNPASQNLYKEGQSLVDYLSSIDPANYHAFPGGGFGFSS